MSRLQSVRENWTEITELLKSDKQHLAQFLRFQASMYKMSFPDAALIYQQNPNATKVAELSTWNKLGRLVNKGERSIAVFGEDNKCKYLFDISQTNGKRVPELWKLSEDVSADLTSVINEKYGKSCKNIQETIAAMAVDNIKTRLPDIEHNVVLSKLSENEIKAYQQSVVSAVRFVVSNRCELGSDMKVSTGINLNAVDSFKDNRDLIRFCDLVQKSAKDTLLEMEREIVQIYTKRREQNHDLQTNIDRTAKPTNSVHGQSERTGIASQSNNEVGKAVAGMGADRVSDGSGSLHNGGQVADNSEGDRRFSRGTLSGTRHTVPSKQSTTDDIQRNSGLGEKQTSLDRTSDYGGDSLSVEGLIKAYKNADFNRRLDNYETAGKLFYDLKGSNIDPVEFFNKFDAEKFSVIQADEIRNIIESAVKNKPVEVLEAPKTEPVIMFNEVVKTSSLPPLEDEKHIAGIIKYDRHFKMKRDKIEEYFDNNKDIEKRSNFIKSIFNNDFTELDVDGVRLGYKSNENGLHIWEGNFLTRTKEAGISWDTVQAITSDLIDKNEYLDIPPKKILLDIPHDKNGYYADDLDDGDIIELSGETWTVASKKAYSIKLVNNNENADEKQRYYFGKWPDRIAELGFELISEYGYSQEHDNNIEPHIEEKDIVTEPIFAEPKKIEPVIFEPDTSGEQLSFFGDDEPVETVIPNKRLDLPSYEITQDMIDYALRCGSNEPKTMERITAQYQKGKSEIENAEFLRNEFGVDGRGYLYTNPETNKIQTMSAWFDKDGITIGAGNTAFNTNSNTHISWEQVSKRIGELYENGEYTSQDNIDRAAQYEMRTIAENLWYLHQDCEAEYFIPDEMFKGGFPDSTERITASLTDKNTVQKYIDGLTDLTKQYEENRNILRYHFHKPKALLEKLKDLQLERKDFITKSDFSFNPKYFVTEDEKDKVVSHGGNIQDSKFRIAQYFNQEHSAKEKADFLKNGYGTGGTGRTGFNIWHDSAGLVYSKGESLSKPDCSITMKWNEVASRVERLISEGKYITQKDIDERIRHAKYTINNTKPIDDVNRVMIKNAQKVLDEYGISNEPQKSPVQKIIEKAQAAGIPVEIMDTPQEIDITIEKDKAVFMDTRDESFISVMQTDEGIDYTMYAPDLTPIDSGVWEMDEYIDLEFAASELLSTSEKMIAEVPDYDKFIELADMNTDLNVPTELSQMKADILANIPDEKPVQKQAHKQEQPKVDTPEKISAVKFEKKTGTPVTYHFNSDDLVQGGAKSKFNANVEAIKTLQTLEKENRYATPEEQAIMAKYVGWGGIPQAFTTDRAAESLGGNVGNSAPTGWENEQKELLSLLSVDEYKAARASTLTSFYTPPEVTDGVYQALSQFGFEGGNVLEPSMGVGNFFAKMPEDIRDNSRLYGVELDSVSGRIAQQLYPNERIQVKGFEQTSFNNNSFDVVVGNIPFGDYKVSDKAYDKHNFKIHDYFAAKAVDKVKPGGVVALVTSKFTMDKHNEKARRYLAERCDLLGAVRLPNDAFKKNAGTEVTTDILFLKKRETLTVEVPDWVHMSQTEDGIPCNKYFVDNPDMVLGKMAWDERMQGKYGADSKVTTCIADDNVPLAEQIKNAVSKIEGSIETVRAEEKEKDEQQYIPADPSVRNFTHTIVDGDLYFRENEVMLKVQETGKTLDRMMGLHKIRQAAMAVIDGQAEGCSDIELSALQNELNSVYDKFKKAYGNITDTMNERCFRNDDDYNTLAALEIVNTEKKTVEKAEIFSKRTIQPVQEITSVDTPQEALQVSIDRVGKVDIEYMAQLVGCEPEKIVADLGNEIFRNPAKIRDDEKYSGYEDASEYLSGNVREKLKIAKDYAKHIDSDFEKNVSALEHIIPKDLEASEISVRIGANWVDIDDYNNFLRECLKADTYNHPVTRTKMGEYKIEGKYQDKRVSATETHGTSRMSSYHIFENLLNQRDVVIRDRRDEDGKVWYEVNAKETQLAKEKARQMKDGFKSWIFNTVDRRQKYVEKYNYLFNAIRGREYDGSRQTFPGMNPSIKLNPHQENAVLRGKLGGNTLLAHCVGAGKSFEMIATSMEKKRLGLINKACVVVPKHLTLQTASEWMRLYPNAKLLVARPEDFTKDNRQKFIARCVTGDYDAVVMSFTQFERIPMSDQYRKQFMERELNEIMDALEEVDSTDRVSVKALERQKRQVEERLEKLLSSPKDNSLCFEKLGFDYLVCDEAHGFKNCFVSTKMSNVAGVQTTAAQKSEDMLMKSQYLNDKYGCNNILFATGTPVSNSMVEFYVMQRYLRPDLLKKADLQTFDDWASTFGEVVSQLEMKPAGDGYRMKNRFSKFVNIPELMQMYKEFADIKTADMLKLPVPEIKTGKPIVISANPDERQQAYMKELAARSEAIHGGNVDPSQDNMLRITHEARLLGLDTRCIFKDAEPTPDSKISMLLDNLEKIYHETTDKKGVQIVFCDIAINEDAEHFSVYEAIKSDLVKHGIPREEICFAGDAQTDKARAEMFEKLRSGEKRFILASTSKLGTGANVQDRICAIHHLDIPWKPSDLEQQNGRGIRQGNMFSEVGIYHYLTKETFDSYMMGIITNKAKFINQIMTSKDPVRVADDVDEMVLTYSEMQAIASGNPMIKEKIQLDNDIAMLKTLEAEHKKSAYKMQELAERILPQRIDDYAGLLQKASNDLKAYQEQHPDNAEFAIKLGDKVFTERADAGDEIEKAIIRCSTTNESIKLGKYFGFDVSIEKNPANSNLFSTGTPCVAVLKGELKYTSDVSLGNNIGNVRRIENLAGIQINQKIQQFSSALDKSKSDLEEAKNNMAKPFEHAEELAKMTSRLDFVNSELSKNHVPDKEPVPVETQDREPMKVSSVVIAVPNTAYSAERVNPKPIQPPPSPQLDNNTYKPKQKSR